MHGLLCVFSSSIFSEMGVGLIVWPPNQWGQPVSALFSQPWVTDTYHYACFDVGAADPDSGPLLTQQAFNPLSRLPSIPG